jgi:16S rRNA (guanine966-N2)-methyltransferase
LEFGLRLEKGSVLTLRIIAGKYRGRKLKTPPSSQTRPTSDRLRETLFNILAPRIEGARFLDLCAGTGAVGIEALSRGASHVTFVDKSRKMCELIQANLEALHIEKSEVEKVADEALSFLRHLAKKGERLFDIIFFDPPYATDYEAVLNLISDMSGILNPEGIVIVEHHKKKSLPEEFSSLKRYREVRQGDSVLSFYGLSDSN